MELEEVIQKIEFSWDKMNSAKILKNLNGIEASVDIKLIAVIKCLHFRSGEHHKWFRDIVPHIAKGDLESVEKAFTILIVDKKAHWHEQARDIGGKLGLLEYLYKTDPNYKLGFLFSLLANGIKEVRDWVVEFLETRGDLVPQIQELESSKKKPLREIAAKLLNIHGVTDGSGMKIQDIIKELSFPEFGTVGNEIHRESVLQKLSDIDASVDRKLGAVIQSLQWYYEPNVKFFKEDIIQLAGDDLKSVEKTYTSHLVLKQVPKYGQKDAIINLKFILIHYIYDKDSNYNSDFLVNLLVDKTKAVRDYAYKEVVLRKELLPKIRALETSNKKEFRDAAEKLLYFIGFGYKD